MTHELSQDQKTFRVNESRMLLDMLQFSGKQNFEGIAADDESWFRCITYGDSMFAPSAEDVVSKTKHTISARKTMIMTFFTSP
jgi:hypothetical protein